MDWVGYVQSLIRLMEQILHHQNTDLKTPPCPPALILGRTFLEMFKTRGGGAGFRNIEPLAHFRDPCRILNPGGTGGRTHAHPSGAGFVPSTVLGTGHQCVSCLPVRLLIGVCLFAVGCVVSGVCFVSCGMWCVVCGLWCGVWCGCARAWRSLRQENQEGAHA